MLQWSYYQPTQLEKQVMNLYQSIGIEKPVDIDEVLIASCLGIKLMYERNILPLAYENDRVRFIVLDKSLTAMQQRLDFFHELGHLLRGHAGDQTELPDLFSGLQEEQADHFAKYALMPYQMIQNLDFPEYERDVPYLLSSEFRVPIDLAKERWDQIKRRISAGRWEQACIERERNRYRKASSANWCDEAKKMFRTAIQRKMEKGQGVVFR
ncbi:ImmA/IrrE family metallo-endopeptidase [Brevibacillus sp. H7]|uniref:ImmA/IrrE family metallo-endopeptidase n=1 Tax=Brevibacillus sp. H7 TaxID=3349138 RepID=UPI0037FBB8E1